MSFWNYMPSAERVSGLLSRPNTNPEKRAKFEQRESIIVENLSSKILNIPSIQREHDRPIIHDIGEIVLRQIEEEFKKRAQQLKNRIYSDTEYKTSDADRIDYYVQSTYKEKLIQIIMEILDEYGMTRLYSDFLGFFNGTSTLNSTEQSRAGNAYRIQEYAADLRRRGVPPSTIREEETRLREEDQVRYAREDAPRVIQPRSRSRSRQVSAARPAGGSRNTRKSLKKNRKTRRRV